MSTSAILAFFPLKRFLNCFKIIAPMRKYLPDLTLEKISILVLPDLQIVGELFERN